MFKNDLHFILPILLTTGLLLILFLQKKGIGMYLKTKLNGLGL